MGRKLFEASAKKANLFIKWEHGDIFTYHTSKQKDKPLMGGYYIENDKPLSLEEAKAIYQALLDFFKNSLHHFLIVATGGFEAEAFELEQFNLKLVDIYYIEELNEMGVNHIEMLPHNQKAFKSIMEQLEKRQKTAVVQATGTGKSFLACKTIQALNLENNLIVAPSHYILEQFKKISPIKNVTYMTYKWLSKLPQSEIEGYDFIVLDEFHRIGAETWGSGVGNLLHKNQNAKVLGLSATPIRYLDNERDMSKELFEGSVAQTLSLEEAIARNILPNPVYVSAIYDISHYIREKVDYVRKSRISKIEKKELMHEIDLVRRNWEKGYGIPSILSEHIKEKASKFIVFIESIDDLESMQQLVNGWFQTAFKEKEIKSFVIHSSQSLKENDQTMAEFDKPNEKSIHLLFSINMLNEGLHVKDTSGVILMRKTISPTIYFQQIGRALQSHFNSTPYIFDFVNNFKNVNARYLGENIESEINKYEKELGHYDIRYKLDSFKIIDLAMEALMLFESIEERISTSWDVMFELYKEYVKDNEDKNVPYECIYKEQKLGLWVTVQRRLKKTGKIREEREKLLNAEGFIWDRIEDLWDRSFSLLKQFYDKNGGPTPFISAEFDKSHDSVSLSAWCRIQRQIYKEDKMPKDRFDKLSSIGFCFDDASIVYDSIWMDMFNLLASYKEAEGHTRVPIDYTIDGKDLGNWASRQRTYKRNGSLKEKYRELLDSICFTWDLADETWDANYEKLCAFKKEFNTLKIPIDYMSGGTNLTSWCSAQRVKYKNGTLSEDKVDRLKAIDFKFDVAAEIWDENFNAYCEFMGDDPLKKIPADQIVNGVNIDSWSQMQRHLYRKNKLSQDKIDRLNAILFPWNKIEALWLNAFNQYKGYIEDGNTLDNVPKIYKSFNIRDWIYTQKKAFKDGKMSDSRLEKLKEVNFKFS